MTDQRFHLQAQGVAFPKFSFGVNADGTTVNVTHHYIDCARDNENRKVLRRRTDTLQRETARRLYGALLEVGFKAIA